MSDKPAPVNRAFQRRLATGTNSTLVTFLTVAIVAVLYLLIEPYRLRIDLSASQESTLMEDTRNKLRLLEQGAGGTEGADQVVRITAFSAQEGKKEAYFKNRQLQDLVSEIDYASPTVEARFVDFDRERLTAEELGVTEYGTVVIQRPLPDGKVQRVDLRDRELFRSVGKGADRTIEFMGESAINRAFSQLMADTSRVVYALVGHGELDPENPDIDGLSELKKALSQENYLLKRLDLVRDNGQGGSGTATGVPRVPEDAAAVIIARPRVPIPAVEQDLLLAYLSGGGPLLISVEPGGLVPEVLGRLGVAVPEGRVLDRLLVFPFPDRPVPRYKPHPITQTLSDALLVTVVAGAAPVQAAVPPREGIRSMTLLETSRDGWIERGGPMEGANALYQPGIDAPGPAAMAVALEIGQDSGLVRRGLGRIIVLGDSDMIGNGLLLEGPGNLSFAVNALRWLVGDDGRLSVSGRPAQSRKLALTAEDRERIGWVAIGIGPMVAMLLGAGMWVSRRGR